MPKKQKRESWIARNVLPFGGLAVAGAAVVLLSGAATPTPSQSTTTAAPPPAVSSSAASSAGPLFTCAANQFYLTNGVTGGGGTGYAYFNNSEDRLTMSSNSTEFCTNKQSGNDVQIDLIGENNCLTYAGPKTGKSPLGYVDKTTCTNKVSQQWSLEANHLIYNFYAGRCLDGPQFDRDPFMEACNASDPGQDWYLQT